MGTCEDMCPPEELAQRRRIEDIAQLERLRPDQRATDASMAVKKFSAMYARFLGFLRFLGLCHQRQHGRQEVQSQCACQPLGTQRPAACTAASGTAGPHRWRSRMTSELGLILG